MLVGMFVCMGLGCGRVEWTCLYNESSLTIHCLIIDTPTSMVLSTKSICMPSRNISYMFLSDKDFSSPYQRCMYTCVRTIVHVCTGGWTFQNNLWQINENSLYQRCTYTHVRECVHKGVARIFFYRGKTLTL